jgi:phosphate starvation-inducible PhoH-like protein
MCRVCSNQTYIWCFEQNYLFFELVLSLGITIHLIKVDKFINLYLDTLVEKIITLENISLIDFLGVENNNIKEVAAAFPSSRIISRGNEIRIKGSTPEIIKINDILNSLLEHYHKYGRITQENVLNYIQKDEANLQQHTNEDDILLYGTKGFAIKPKTANQKKLVENAEQHDLVFALGPAGTGKTYISVALAVRALKNKEVKKIIITRPAVEAGENLGFLPGDLKEKIDPYLRPIYDALDDMIPSEKLKYYQENRIIEIAPLAYMRGRTLNNAFILLDEAQNTTPMQMKMFLTRMGPNSKVVVTGDKSQVDLPRHHKSGLVEAIKVLKDIKGIGFVELDAKDVVRHRLVKDIIQAYDHAENDDKK